MRSPCDLSMSLPASATGRRCRASEIDAFVAGVTDGSIPDYQASALLMAIVLRGMSDEETGWLTDAMVRSGDRVDLSDIPGVKVGKHSTGGVGDKVSIVLAPLAAACGVDRAEDVGPRARAHRRHARQARIDSRVPHRPRRSTSSSGAARRRDRASSARRHRSRRPTRSSTRCATSPPPIESIPLISASIMSKKLAEGSDALVLDVKCGDGAFMKDRERRAGAGRSRWWRSARQAGVRTEAFITDMDAPLGRAVGNALEIVECLDTLKGSGSGRPDRRSSCALAARMLVLGGAESRRGRGDRSGSPQALASGRALRDVRADDRAAGRRPARRRRLFAAAVGAATRTICRAPRAGYRDGDEGRGDRAGEQRAGRGARTRSGDPIDHGVGIIMLAKPATRVRSGQPLLELHHRDGRGLEAATRAVRRGRSPSATRRRATAECAGRGR